VPNDELEFGLCYVRTTFLCFYFSKFLAKMAAFSFRIEILCEIDV
jgi:hypothetical protein